MKLLNRYWINQPSKLQPNNNLHGENVLAHISKGQKYTRIYFTRGNVISMEIATLSLSPGWKK